MQARTRILSALCAALLLTSCAEDSTSDPPIAVQADAVKVTVNNNGSGNKQTLRFQPTSQDQQATLTVDDGFHQTTSNGDESPEEIQTMTLPVTANASDERKVTLTVGTPTYSDSSLNEELATAKDFRVSWQGDTTGRIETLEFSAPPNATDTARAATERFLQHVLNMPIVFPEEEIGEGAKWQVESRVSGGSTLLQTTTFIAKKIQGSQVELDVVVEQRPAVGALPVTDSQGKSMGDLKVLDSKTNSQGSLVIDLQNPLPKGNIQFTTTVQYGGDSNVTVTQTATTRIAYK
ncbi:hypothetical protein [Corynebacterium freiburgense]|uniref:hypothetical protein n=1 Tax=Corynebacterium freiburgense TaxID=556548 RepID=UPI00047ED320|nr:hypothetical protein [Corynebacterium freiburgense]WJZ03131.1 hypothetical protein CFREI_09265 [Corynebacterium freiburgense]